MKSSTRLTLLLISTLIGMSCGSSTHFATRYYRFAQRNGPYDAVIVPGVPYQGPSAKLNLMMAARIYWAKYLYDHGIAKHIIFSGAAVGTPYIEGQIMKIIADSMGLPSEVTFAETRAEHSTENVWYGLKMAKRLGFKKVALATDPFQTRTLRNFIYGHCDDIPFIPIIYHAIDSSGSRLLPLPTINPKSAYVSPWVALTDREGFYKRLIGTLGWHINFKEKD